MALALRHTRLMALLVVVLLSLAIVTFFVLGMMTQSTSHVVTVYSNYGP